MISCGNFVCIFHKLASILENLEAVEEQKPFYCHCTAQHCRPGRVIFSRWPRSRWLIRADASSSSVVSMFRVFSKDDLWLERREHKLSSYFRCFQVEQIEQMDGIVIFKVALLVGDSPDFSSGLPRQAGLARVRKTVPISKKNSLD